MRRWVCGLLCLLLCASLVLPASASGGYTVSIPTEATIASGGTVTIPVTISEGTGSYNAVDIRITFDATKLEYASSTLTKDQVTLTNGTIYVRFYGKAQKTGAELGQYAVLGKTDGGVSVHGEPCAELPGCTIGV